MDVATQGEFSQITGAATLLELLETHIRACTGVVGLIGARPPPSQTDSGLPRRFGLDD